MGEQGTQLSRKREQEDYLLDYRGIVVSRENSLRVSDIPKHLLASLVSVAAMVVFGIVAYKGGPWYVSVFAFLVSVMALIMIWRSYVQRRQQERESTAESRDPCKREGPA